MKQEDKDLLLKDLCARLPYGVKVWHFDTTRELLGIIPSTENVMVGYDINDYEDSVIEDIKPYLRPMSSMTEEEKNELKELHFYYIDAHIVNDEDDDFNPIIVDEVHCSCIIDWLLKNHFDFRGLIPKGLAIEVTEENNPYEKASNSI